MGEWVRDFAASWRYRWTLVKIAVLCSGEQCHAAIHAAMEAAEHDREECHCRAHRGRADAEPYSRGPEPPGGWSGEVTSAAGIAGPPGGYPANGAGQWANETRRDRTRYGGPDQSAETIRLGVARGERPLPGVRMPFPVYLVPNDSTAEEREAWFMPDGVIGSLALQVACPQCSVTMTHPCIGANANAVLVICDNRECAHVWTITSFREAFPKPSGTGRGW